MDRPQAVLFDLDGTLADTAPDLADALNRLRAEHDMPPLPEQLLRRWTSNGTRGMLRVGFDLEPDDRRFPPLAKRYLAIYGSAPCVRTRLFPGLAESLDALEAAGVAWGVVTNKPRELAEQVLDGLGLSRRAACLIGGMCAAAPKPSPEPLLLACRRTRWTAAACVYVGDDERDIIAGRAAGMSTLAAAWGYLGDHGDVAEWQADGVVEHPAQLAEAILGAG
ncbi:MAG: HAD-IA family hydrolase [Rhodocyclaceae bacterium]|nr:HAD-IA family hydrolase [Rhodocyclaceae bacterium]